MAQKTDLNFDFINQQPSVPVKNRVSTKVKILGIMLILLLIITAFGVIFGNNKQQKVANIDPNASANVQFLQAMSTVDEVNLAKARELLSDDLQSNQTMAVGALLRLRGSIDFATCKETETKQGEKSKTSHYYNCQTRDGNSVNLEIINSDKIEAIRIEA